MSLGWWQFAPPALDASDDQPIGTRIQQILPVARVNDRETFLQSIKNPGLQGLVEKVRASPVSIYPEKKQRALEVRTTEKPQAAAVLTKRQSGGPKIDNNALSKSTQFAVEGSRNAAVVNQEKANAILTRSSSFNTYSMQRKGQIAVERPKGSIGIGTRRNSTLQTENTVINKDAELTLEPAVKIAAAESIEDTKTNKTTPEPEKAKESGTRVTSTIKRPPPKLPLNRTTSASASSDKKGGTLRARMTTTTNVPNKLDHVNRKLALLDSLMEDLELDITEVMISDNWKPIREIVKELQLFIKEK